jgi:hypothetical protein
MRGASVGCAHEQVQELGCIEYNGQIVAHPSLLHAVLNDKLEGEQQI